MALTERFGGRASAASRKHLAGQTGERSRRDEDAERRKLVQGISLVKYFCGRITVVWWLTGLLLRSSPFLSSRSSVSASLRSAPLGRWDGTLCVRHPYTHLVCASWQAGKKCTRQLLRVACAQQHRPGALFIVVVSPRIRVSSARGQSINRTPSGLMWRVPASCTSVYFGRQSSDLKCASSLAGPLPRRQQSFVFS